MMTNVDRYWAQYLDSLPARATRRYAGVAAFGITSEDARAIASLVRDGIKTATGGLVWANEADGNPEPRLRPGDLWIVIAGPDEPVCIIETTEVRIFPYDEVPDEYAWEGGEGDRSVRDWCRIYWNYIVSECKRIGREPSVKAPLAMERFRLVYSETLRLEQER